jgi:hypothetical protein
MRDPAELLAAYDSQLRTNVPDPLPEGSIVERDRPLVRFLGAADRAWVHVTTTTPFVWSPPPG